MTQEQLIELIEELFDGWDCAATGYARGSDKPADDQIRDKVKALIAALKRGDIVLTAEV